MANTAGIQAAQLLRLNVKNGRLDIHTGIAVVNHPGNKSTSKKWNKGSYSFLLPQKGGGKFKRAVVTASLAAVANNNTAVDEGYRVSNFRADWDDDARQIRVTVDVAARDTDGVVESVSYSVFGYFE